MKKKSKLQEIEQIHMDVREIDRQLKFLKSIKVYQKKK
jgi:hypothetical protein